MTKITDLSDTELQYMEQLLGKELSKEIEVRKTWNTKNHYYKPLDKSNQILNCMNAVKNLRNSQKLKAEKW